MHLRIVPQWLKMSHTLHGVLDGFFIEDPPVFKGHIQTKALGDQTSQNFQLDLAHDLHMDLLAALVPKNVQLGILLFQKPQLLQGGHGVGAGRQYGLIGHHRFQLRGQCRFFDA